MSNYSHNAKLANAAALVSSVSDATLAASDAATLYPLAVGGHSVRAAIRTILQRDRATVIGFAAYLTEMADKGEEAAAQARIAYISAKSLKVGKYTLAKSGDAYTCIRAADVIASGAKGKGKKQRAEKAAGDSDASEASDTSKPAATSKPDKLRADLRAALSLAADASDSAIMQAVRALTSKPARTVTKRAAAAPAVHAAAAN